MTLVTILYVLQTIILIAAKDIYAALVFFGYALANVGMMAMLIGR